MSSGKQPPKGGNKPFLGDADLGSELDAWDATFDALHEEAAPGAAPVAEQVMEWPVPSTAPLEVAPDAILSSEPRDALHDFDPSRDLDLDEPMTRERAATATAVTLDRDFSAPRTAPAASEAMFDAGPSETDFSDVGADGPPQALGDLLGRHGTAPLLEDEQTRLVPTTSRATTRPGELERSSGPQIQHEDDDEQVFTSASRPTFAPRPVDRGFDDVVAPPPAPAPEPRRGPAIVRRTPLQVPIAPKEESHKTPARGVDVSAFADESTRIQDVDEIRAQAHQSRAGSATLPPPIVEDDYADIEIDASSGGDSVGAPAAPLVTEQPSLDSAAVGRRTAHVVRRGEASTRPPPVASPRPDAHALEMDIDEPPEAAPASEDDFSDVAAAVGASDDDPLAGFEAIPAIKTRRPSTPPIERGSAQDIVVVDDEPRATHGLEDALSGLEPVVQEDDAGGFALPDLELGNDLHEPAAPLAPSSAGSKPAVALADLYPRVKTPTSVPLSYAQRLPTPVPVEHAVAPEIEPELDLDVASRSWPEQLDPLPSATLDEACAQVLLVYERELSTVDDSAATAALRVEAGRLCERLTDVERARAHYDAALLADPRATAALRGLRRLARASGDLEEATRQLDAEIAVAGALERRPLGHYRIDLLMASGDQDLARVAVGELLDSAPSDVRALLAHLELAFLDGRADEFGAALEQLAHAVTDPELRAAVQSARGVLAAHHNDSGAAAGWFAAAAESDPTALAARIGAVRHAAAQADGEAAARALVELARQIEITDPLTAAAAAVRAQQWAAGEIGASAAAIATTSAPGDPLVARLAAETAAAAGDVAIMNGAFTHWASIATAPAERAYAAARAAELDPARGAELWGVALARRPR